MKTDAMNTEEMQAEINRLTILSTKLADMLNEKINECEVLKATEKSLWYEIDYLRDELDSDAVFSSMEKSFQQ